MWPAKEVIEYLPCISCIAAIKYCEEDFKPEGFDAATGVGTYMICVQREGENKVKLILFLN